MKTVLGFNDIFIEIVEDRIRITQIKFNEHTERDEENEILIPIKFTDVLMEEIRGEINEYKNERRRGNQKK